MRPPRTPLQVGDRVSIDWDLNGRRTEHVITAVQTGMVSQSRICYQVTPAIRLNTEESWIDHDWFKHIKLPPKKIGIEEFFE